MLQGWAPEGEPTNHSALTRIHQGWQACESVAVTSRGLSFGRPQLEHGREDPARTGVKQRFSQPVLSLLAT
jgi:hypothetical protein